MSATDPQVPTTEVIVPRGQGSLGKSNLPSVIIPPPDLVGLVPTQLFPEMEGFYGIVGIPSSELGTMVKAGYMSPGYLVYLDKSVINQLLIKLSSKA